MIFNRVKAFGSIEKLQMVEQMLSPETNQLYLDAVEKALKLYILGSVGILTFISHESDYRILFKHCQDAKLGAHNESNLLFERFMTLCLDNKLNLNSCSQICLIYDAILNRLEIDAPPQMSSTEIGLVTHCLWSFQNAWKLGDDLEWPSNVDSAKQWLEFYPLLPRDRDGIEYFSIFEIPITSLFNGINADNASTREGYRVHYHWKRLFLLLNQDGSVLNVDVTFGSELTALGKKLSSLLNIETNVITVSKDLDKCKRASFKSTGKGNILEVDLVAEYFDYENEVVPKDDGNAIMEIIDPQFAVECNSSPLLQEL